MASPVRVRPVALRKPGSLVCIGGAISDCLIFDLPNHFASDGNCLHTEALAPKDTEHPQPYGIKLGKPHRRRCSRPIMNVVNTALLVCCPSLYYVILTPLTSGKILTRPEPEIRGSRADLRLPFYTSGFK